MDSDAAELLIELARRDRVRPLQILAIGCATNIASALLLAPDIASRIVVSWTSAYPSFWPYPNASYNLAQDLHAARVLFESGVPLVYLPGYYVGEELRVSLPEVEAHVAPHGPLGAYLAEIYRAWGAAAHRPGTSKVLWDLINVAWIVDPSWLATDLVRCPQPGSRPPVGAPPSRPPCHAGGNRCRPRLNHVRPVCPARRAGSARLTPAHTGALRQPRKDPPCRNLPVDSLSPSSWLWRSPPARARPKSHRAPRPHRRSVGRPFPATLPVVSYEYYRDTDLNARPQAMAISVGIAVFVGTLVVCYAAARCSSWPP